MYKFPYIEHLNDVLPYIKDKPEFRVLDKGEYKVIDYMFTDSETWPVGTGIDAAMVRECRGITFDKDGYIIRRPYHKFFNVNERADTQLDKIEFDISHWDILEKLDGSQIVPFMVNGKVLWGTKKGVTEVSEVARTFLEKHFIHTAVATYFLEKGYNPIFEWCSNKNRIVIEHSRDRLVLTAIRHIKTGEYLPYASVQAAGEYFGIEHVRSLISNIKELEQIVNRSRSEEEIEGYVLRHYSGHMLKCKADWYVDAHQTVAFITQEPRVVSMILDNVIDDVIPILPMEVDKIKVKKYQVALHQAIFEKTRVYQVDINAAKLRYTRKEFALGPAKEMDQIKAGVYFACWDDYSYENVRANIEKRIKKSLTKMKEFVKIKELFYSEALYE